MISRARLAAPLAMLLCLLTAPARSAPEVVAVIGGSPGPYADAFAGFAAAFGGEVAAVRLPRRPTERNLRARVVVAFGGEAAALPYAKGTTVIACLAPGLTESQGHAASRVALALRPAPEHILAGLRRLQPGLKRLAVLSHPRGRAQFLANLKTAGAAVGVEILELSAEGPEGVPDALRSLPAASADALWLSPDPALVNPSTFQTIKQFSEENRLPFYAPTRGLVLAGATAAVAVDAAETGRQAAGLARRALAGEALPGVVYPAGARLTVNRASASKAGLTLSPAALADDEVIP